MMRQLLSVLAVAKARQARLALTSKAASGVSFIL